MRKIQDPSVAETTFNEVGFLNKDFLLLSISDILHLITAYSFAIEFRTKLHFKKYLDKQTTPLYDIALLNHSLQSKSYHQPEFY